MNRQQRREAQHKHASRRSLHHPAPADTTGGVRLLWRAQPYTAEELVRLKLPIRAAYDEIKAGRGTQKHWADLAVAMNVTLVRAEAIHPLMEVTARAACEALERMRERYTRTQRWGFDGLGLQQVDECIDLHEQLLDLSTPRQMIEAGREARVREAEQMRATPSQAALPPAPQICCA